MKMVKHIFTIPRYHYAFTLSGGEPTLHPFLGDIIKYIASSGRKFSLDLETNGSREVEYYLDLFRGLPQKSVRLSIAAHPAQLAVDKLASLITSVTGQGQMAHVRLANDPALPNASAALGIVLDKLSRIMPCTWEFLNMPGLVMRPSWEMSQNVVLINDTQEEISTLAGQDDTDPFTIENVAKSLPSAQTPCYCCQGATFLRIEPDGHFYGAACPMTFSPLPLWHDKANTNLSRLFYCQEICPGGANNLLPKFPAIEEGRRWLNTFLTLEAENALFAPPLPLLPGEKPDMGQIILARLARLTASEDSQGAGTVKPDIQGIWSRMADIVSIYETLGTQCDREAFLRILRCIQTGDTGYLRDSDDVPDYADVFPVYPAPGFIDKTDSCELSDLIHFKADIYDCFPKLRIRLPLNANALVNLLLWLLEELPAGYETHLAIISGVPFFFAAHPGQAQPHPLFSSQMLPPSCIADGVKDAGLVERPELSLIIVADNCQDVIASSLDSILLQASDSLEIIIVDNASTDATSTLIERRAEIAGKNIRVVTLTKSVPMFSALNTGRNVALGKYFVFAAPGQIFAPDFLATISAIISDQKPDIIVCSPEHGKTRGNCAINDTADAVAFFIDSWIDNPSIYGFVFNASLIIDSNIRFGDIRNFEHLQFGLAAFYNAQTIILQKGLLFHSVPQDQKLAVSFADWVEALAFVNRYFVSHNLDSAGLEDKFAANLYDLSRDSVLEEIRNAAKIGRLDKLLQLKRILTVGGSKATLTAILGDYAKDYCERNSLVPIVDDKDLDWELARQSFCPDADFTVYGNADTSLGEVPRISVIVPNYNKAPYLTPCLDAILSQSMRDIELIIVDDASTDESWELLQDYADFEPRIRLYRMRTNCRQGVARNIAVQKARGEYLVFVDSDDLMAPGFLEYAYAEANKNDADVGVFAWQKMENGKISWRAQVKEEIIGNGDGIAQYFDSQIMATVWAKIFKTSLIRACDCRFEEYIYHQDNHFLVHALKYAKTIIKRNFCATTIIYTPDSTTRPRSRRYLHIRSSVCMHDFLHKLKKGGYDCKGIENHIAWHLEAMFLPAIHAFRQKLGYVPLADDEYCLIRHNETFLRILLEKFALIASSKSKPAHSTARAVQSLPPVVSVIISDENGVAATGLQHTETILFNCGIETHGWYDACSCEYVLFADTGVAVSSNDLLKAAALLHWTPQADFVCFTQPGANGSLLSIDPGLYNARDLLHGLCVAGTAPLSPGACVFRKSFLQQNRIFPPRYRLGVHTLVTLALLEAKTVILEQPESIQAKGHATPRLHDLLVMANAIFAILRHSAPVNAAAREVFIRNILIDLNLTRSIAESGLERDMLNEVIPSDILDIMAREMGTADSLAAEGGSLAGQCILKTRQN